MSQYQKQSSSTIEKVKVVVVGDVNVGKTCLALRFAKNIFHEGYETTVGAAFLVRSLDFETYKAVFQIWDTAGQERFKSLVPMYLRDAKGALLVYDVTDMKSFSNLKMWLAYIKKYGPKDTKIVLAGNKSDLPSKSVNTAVAETFAQTHGILFKEVSAKTGDNVEELFIQLAQLIPRESEAVNDETYAKLHKSNEASAFSFRQSCC